jgi:hypothetical protein
MARRRRRHPSRYLVCDACGRFYPYPYRCDCSQSALIARVYEVFPNTKELSNEDLLLRGPRDDSDT